MGADAGAHRPRGRRQLGGLAWQPPLLRLRGASRRDRRSGRLSDRPAPRAAAAAARATPADRPSRPAPAALEGAPTSRAAGARSPRGRPGTGRAAAGLQLGPHLLVPWLAGWDWDELDPEIRKSFEVALHAGAAAALLIGQRRVIAERAARVRRSGARSCSRCPSSPRRSSATGSSARSSGASAGRGRPRPGCSPERRRCSSPTGGRRSADAARLAAGRWAGARNRPGGGAGARASRATAPPSPPRAGGGSRRDHANLLSRTVALPVIVGATALKGAPAAPAAGAPTGDCGGRWRRGRPRRSSRPSPPSA